MIRVVLDSGIDKLSGTVDGNRIQDAAATFKLSGSSAEFNVFTADSFAVEVRSGRDALLAVSGLGDWRAKTSQGGLQFNAEGQLAPLLALYPLPDIALKSGVAKFSGQIAKRSTDMTANASASLGSLTGTVGKSQLVDYQANADFSVTATGLDKMPVAEIDIQRASVSAQSGFNGGGTLDFHGKYSLAKQAGTFDFKSVNLNESALGPFVAPAVAPNKLISVAVDLNGKAEINLAAKSSAVIDIKVTNFRAEDPAHRFPATPLSAGLSLDVTQQGAVSDIRRIELDLGATARASNKLSIAGHVDLSTNKPTPSTVSLRSDGLDLTQYYDLFAGSTTNAEPAQPSRPAQTKSDPNVEPAPIHLPLRDLTGDIDIAHVYLREIDVGAVKGRVVLKDDHIALDPFGLTINGGPVTARVLANLAVAGYEYDVKFGAGQVLLAPLANSFVLDLKGLATGNALATINLKGAGVTGPNLRKNLGGLVLVVATNAQIRIPDKAIKLPAFLTWLPIFPNEINPATVLALIGKKSVLSEPISTVQTRVDIDRGVARLSETRVSSPAILAEVVGTVQLNDVVTNSTLNLPVSVAIGGNGPLPAARTIGKAIGTIGNPKFDKDLVALASLGMSILPGGGVLGDKAAGALQGAADKLNAKTGGALGAVGNLIGGANAGAGTPAAKTNAAPAGSALGNVLNALGGAPKGTNPAAANTNKAINPLDFLPFGRKK
ncbi:MAG: hypothetical protein DVB31_07720 [Verrucomicrobia bacterium]|nr:MAG: hypothetical protein DVB31_07720 [Verrucomicrobiota bacterium]